MTPEQSYRGVEDTVPHWWEHGWREREDMSFEEWLDEWHKANTPEAAMGLLDIILSCYSRGDPDARIHFLFHLVKRRLPSSVERSVGSGTRNSAAVRIQRKAEETLILQVIKDPDKRDYLSAKHRWAGPLVRDAAAGGTLFAELMRYFVDECSHSLDDEARHYQSAVKQMLKAASRGNCSSDDGLEGFDRVRDANLAVFYRALIAFGLEDLIDSCAEPSLKALEEIVFKPTGFPAKAPADLAEAATEGSWQVRTALSRLMYLRTLERGRRRVEHRR